MKNRDLIKILLEADMDAEVIIQKDAEGNAYSPLDGAVTNTVYIPESKCSGEVYGVNSTADEVGMSEEDWKKTLQQKRCITLFPKR